MPHTVVLALLASLAAAPASAQGYTAPRTSYGAPDLDGVWNAATSTRLQRAKNAKGLVATADEIAAAEKRRRERNAKLTAASDPAAPAPPSGEDVGDIESEWFDLDVGPTRIAGQVRNSLVVDPPDGQIPWSEAGRKAIEEAAARDEKDFSGPEVRASDERCLTGVGGVSGPPMLSSGYNNHIQIVQTPSAIAMVVEMNHDVRIIRLDQRQRPPGLQPTWLGDSVGWWEGDTLVVETVGQHPGAAWRWRPDGILWVTPKARVVERFTRISKTEILYAFTVEDPLTLTRPWRAEAVLSAASQPMYEYACHEGNYSLPNILGGARQKEREGAEAKVAPGKQGS